MKKILLAITIVGFVTITSLTTYVLAQTAAPTIPPFATDVTAEDIVKFIDNLPRDRVSDRPIRSVEVTIALVFMVFLDPRNFQVAPTFTK